MKCYFSAVQAQNVPQMKVLQVGEKKKHPGHVPDHLPAFPDPHTYIKTPVCRKGSGFSFKLRLFKVTLILYWNREADYQEKCTFIYLLVVACSKFNREKEKKKKGFQVW